MFEYVEVTMVSCCVLLCPTTQLWNREPNCGSSWAYHIYVCSCLEKPNIDHATGNLTQMSPLEYAEKIVCDEHIQKGIINFYSWIICWIDNSWLCKE